MRAATVTILAAVATLGLATAAQAHTEVEIDNPQAGGTNVKMTMTAEAEQDSSGIVSVHVVLPEGLTASQITLVSGPAGWQLTPATDGYTVAGKALRVHTNATMVTRIAQLPSAATALAFKTLVTYANGHVDRWIEVPSAANPKPDNPAPVVSLRPAAVTTSAPASAATTQAAPTPTGAATTTAQGLTRNTSSSPVGWVIAVIVVLVAAALTATLVVRRRRRQST